MIWPMPAVIIHNYADGHAVLAQNRPVTLISAPGAALFAGCGWWMAMVAQLLADHPGRIFEDWLDCGDAPGRAAEALRIGQRRLILRPATPLVFERVRLMAEECGAAVLPAPPPALDLASPGARRQLAAWLAFQKDQAGESSRGDNRGAFR